MCNKTNAKEMNWIADAGRLGRIAVMVMIVVVDGNGLGGEEDDAMDERCECEGEITPRVIRFLTDEVQLSRVR